MVSKTEWLRDIDWLVFNAIFTSISAIMWHGANEVYKLFSITKRSLFVN